MSFAICFIPFISFRPFSPLFFHPLFLTMELHQLSLSVSSQETLGRKTLEMRLFERCFLVKMQGKTATQSMDGINLLLNDTCEHISALTNKLKTIKVHMGR